MFIQLIQRNLFDGIEEEVFVSFFYTHIHFQFLNTHMLHHIQIVYYASYLLISGHHRIVEVVGIRHAPALLGRWFG